MSQNKFDQFKDLVTRLVASDGTIPAEHAHELLDTELAGEMLGAVAGGLLTLDAEFVFGCGGGLREKVTSPAHTTTPSATFNFPPSNPYAPGGLYGK